MDQNEFIIKQNDYVIVKRHEKLKLHQMKKSGKMQFGKFTIKIEDAIGHRYFDRFQMRNQSGNEKIFLLEKVENGNVPGCTLNISESGQDNRNITINGDSQTLTKEDIDKLQDSELSSNAIIEKLVMNSKTFTMKTEYSQEKYIKKKAQKYFEYIQILKPNIRLMAKMFYRENPAKVLWLRIDDLSQIITRANIQSEGNHMLYESGSCGLIPAVLMNAIGANTSGILVHMFPDNKIEKHVFDAMGFPDEQRQRCVHVNVHSFFSYYYQKTNTEEENEDPPVKKQKIDLVQARQYAYEILTNKCDSLVVILKEHPDNIVKELLQFLNGSRRLVVFSLMRELLEELFLDLRTRTDITDVQLSNNFLRNYQILPERTHPNVNMSNSGYILSALKLNC